TCCRFSPRKWISSLAWRNAAIPFRLNFSASCTLIIHPQHACILQAHLVLETDPCFRLILYWKRVHLVAATIFWYNLTRDGLKPDASFLCLGGDFHWYARTAVWAMPAASSQAVSAAGGMKLMARSVRAVMVRLGFTPKFAATTDPSQTYMFLYPKTRWRESTTPLSAESAITQPPRQCAVPGMLNRISGTMLKAVPPARRASFSANSLACGM